MSEHMAQLAQMRVVGDALPTRMRVQMRRHIVETRTPVRFPNFDEDPVRCARCDHELTYAEGSARLSDDDFCVTCPACAYRFITTRMMTADGHREDFVWISERHARAALTHLLQRDPAWDAMRLVTEHPALAWNAARYFGDGDVERAITRARPT